MSDPEDTFANIDLCPTCLLENMPGIDFCARCGTPLSVLATVDPVQRIRSEGYAFDQLRHVNRSWVIVLGVYLLNGPVFVMSLFTSGWLAVFAIPGLISESHAASWGSWLAGLFGMAVGGLWLLLVLASSWRQLREVTGRPSESIFAADTKRLTE